VCINTKLVTKALLESSGSSLTKSPIFLYNVPTCPGDGMVDIEDLKSSAGYSVRVRVPPWAHE
jgi:hypothetical protein